MNVTKNISRKLQNSQCFLRNVTVSEPAEGRRNITKGLGNKNNMKMPTVVVLVARKIINMLLPVP